MGVTRRAWLLGLGGAPTLSRAAEPATLTVLVDGSVEMPQARIVDGQVVGGLQYDVALELGKRLGRPVKFRLLPRRRVEVVLATGQDADLICNYHPAWLPGPLLWSESFLDSGDILVTALRHQPPPRRLLDLAGQRIGTTAGFHYPEMEAALGVDFIRDDAPNVVSSLAKLAAGRMDHALVGRVSFDYLRRRGQVPLEVHPPLMLSTVRTSCALSPRSSLHLADLNTAINQLRSDGGLTRILDQYR